MVPWYRATVTTLAAHLPLSFEADLMVARSSAACVQLCASDENRRVELASTKPAMSANSVDEEAREDKDRAGSTHLWMFVFSPRSQSLCGMFLISALTAGHAFCATGAAFLRCRRLTMMW